VSDRFSWSDLTEGWFLLNALLIAHSIPLNKTNVLAHPFICAIQYLTPVFLFCLSATLPSHNSTGLTPSVQRNKCISMDDTAPPKQDGRRNNGGRREGAGIKKGTELASKRTYDVEALAEVVANRLLSGGKSLPTSRTGPISEHDERLLKRIAGVNVEAFNEILSIDLREVSVLATARMKEKLLADEVKAGELAFMMTSATDKRLALDGSRALHNASVNIQVNNFGVAAKDHLLGELDGLGNVKQAQPVEATV